VKGMAGADGRRFTPYDHSLHSASIHLTGARERRQALAAALTNVLGSEAQLAAHATTIAYASEEVKSAARDMAAMFRDAGRTVELIAPTSLHPVRALWRGGDRREWETVQVDALGGNIGSVRLPRVLTRADSLHFVAAVGDVNTRGPLALGVAARFAHPKWAVLARIAGDRSPRLADVALALRPGWIVLTGGVPPLAIAAVTTDLIAAELVGLALRREMTVTDTDMPGVWEDPLVQRATELRLGVALPTLLTLKTSWEDGGTAPAAFDALCTRLRFRIGLEIVVDVVDDNTSY
jgi:hypothetical protein